MTADAVVSSVRARLHPPTYAMKELHLPLSTGFTATLVGVILSPSSYIIFTAALSLITLAFVRRRRYPR